MTKHKEKKNHKIPKIIISLIFLLISIALVISVIKLNLIPNKFVIIGSLLMLFINLIAIGCLFSKKKWPKIITILLYIMILAVSIIGIHFTNITDKFLDQATNNTIKTYSLKFFILSKTKYEAHQINSRDVYYFDNSEYCEDAITKLNQQFTVNLINNESIADLFNKDIFLIDEATYNLFVEEYNINPNDYYIIYTIDLNYQIENEIKSEKEIDKDKHYFNIFVGAYDFSGYRMDMNKIVTINTKTNQILITNVDRFSYLTVPGYNKKNRLNEIAPLGIKHLFNSLESTLNIKFDYYLVAKAEGLVTLVDDLGGIEYCSDMAFTTYHGKVIGTYDNRGAEHVKVKKGCQHLDGIETLTVARERLAFKNGTHQRDKNTTAILIDIVNELKKPGNISKLSTILNDVNGLYNTSIPRNLITKSTKQYLNKGWDIKVQELTGKQVTANLCFSDIKGLAAILSDADIARVRSKIVELDK